MIFNVAYAFKDTEYRKILCPVDLCRFYNNKIVASHNRRECRQVQLGLSQTVSTSTSSMLNTVKAHTSKISVSMTMQQVQPVSQSTFELDAWIGKDSPLQVPSISERGNGQKPHSLHAKAVHINRHCLS